MSAAWILFILATAWAIVATVEAALLAAQNHTLRNRLNRTAARLHAVRAERAQAQAHRDRFRRLYEEQVHANGLLLPHVDAASFIQAAWEVTAEPVDDTVRRFADGLDETLAEILGSEGE